MKLIKMILKNADGKVIEKEVEERLVSTYKSIGWEIKAEKSEKNERIYDPNNKRNEK